MTVGSAVGAVREIFAKIKAIDAKHGKFDFALCAGDFFGPLKEPSEAENEDDISQLLDGKIEGEIFNSILVVTQLMIVYSSPQMLHHAGRIPAARTRYREIC